MSHIPLYVYLLFALVLWLGFKRCVARTVRIERMAVLPVLVLILAVRGFLELFSRPSTPDLTAAVVGIAFGFFIGWHHVSRWRLAIDRSKRNITVPGDVLMFGVILATFCFEFVVHYGVATHASWAATLAVEPISAFVWSGFVGMSIGRNAHLLVRYLQTPAASAARAM
ncbi:MAG: hypothetical protein ACRYG5_06950 [Janthinobacterium lividum]